MKREEVVEALNKILDFPIDGREIKDECERYREIMNIVSTKAYEKKVVIDYLVKEVR